MKISDIIREKRTERGLTQEQVAGYLGVSTPAVSKWERGSSYPDITLLPPLARLLHTDLNTLLSLHDDLTDLEIQQFASEVEETLRTDSYAAAFQLAMDKIQEYPTCDRLLLPLTLFLDGALTLYAVPDHAGYREQFDTFYERLSHSEEVPIRETALGMVISHHRNRGDFATAEALIEALPTSSIDKEEQLAVHYTHQKKYGEAEQIWARRMHRRVADLQTALMHLLDIAVKEERMEDTAFCADTYEGLSRLFRVPEWICLTAQMQLATVRQDQEACLAVLKRLLPAMEQPWTLSDCPLYRKLGAGSSAHFSTQIAKTIREGLATDQEFAFLRENREFRALMESLGHPLPPAATDI